MRILVLRRAQQMLDRRSVPVTPRLAGVFALDLAIEGVSKTRAVEAALSPDVVVALGLDASVPPAGEMEVWGDRLSRCWYRLADVYGDRSSRARNLVSR
jgi:hypothetical protein